MSRVTDRIFHRHPIRPSTEESTMSTEPTTPEHVRALVIAVRDGELTPEQREALVDLLHSLGTAVTLAARDYYPDSEAAALGYLIATWAPVATAYAELTATVASGSKECAA
jgi:hypothetical protein